MHTGKSYSFNEFLFWTRRRIYILALLSCAPVALYQLAGWRWLAIPWGVVLLLGVAAAFSAGFKIAHVNMRMQEAQRIWTAITSGSRSWALACRDSIPDPDRAARMLYRHLAWLTVLRHELRDSRAWESVSRPYNREYLRRYRIPERERSLDSELNRYIPGMEVSRVLMSDSRALQVLSLQSAQLRELLISGEISETQFTGMQEMLRSFNDQQGRSERLKNFPLPRQYALINTLFIHAFCVLLPLGMIAEFEGLNGVVGAWDDGYVVWLAAPLSLLLSWMCASLDQVGDSSANPFEGGANDVPISRMCEQIEAELREVFGETGVPAVARLESDIAV